MHRRSSASKGRFGVAEPEGCASICERQSSALQSFCGRRGATRDHEPWRNEGSALPIRRGLAATRLETSSFARCATEDESSRRWRRVHAAHSGSFAAPGHERRLRGTRKYTNPHHRRVPEKHVVAVMRHVDYGIIFAMNQTMIYPDECYAIRGAIYEVYQQYVPYFS